VLIGPGVQLVAGSHPVRASDRVVPVSEEEAATAPYRTHSRPITIEDQVWLGAGSIAPPGVTIGAGTTIGVGSFVTADVPPHCLAFGQPWRVQRDLSKRVTAT
jgi:maltose O-acetyltransferase